MTVTEEAVWIKYEREQTKFSHWEYVGGGITSPRFETKIITRRCLYSNDVNQTMINRAQEYIDNDMQEYSNARVVISCD